MLTDDAFTVRREAHLLSIFQLSSLMPMSVLFSPWSFEVILIVIKGVGEGQTATGSVIPEKQLFLNHHGMASYNRS